MKINLKEFLLSNYDGQSTLAYLESSLEMDDKFQDCNEIEEMEIDDSEQSQYLSDLEEYIQLMAEEK